jgi:hypothetical protein
MNQALNRTTLIEPFKERKYTLRNRETSWESLDLKWLVRITSWPSRPIVSQRRFEC